MVQELTVECPHCHQVADIYLSTNACVIILNCPSCASPIMYFDQKIFILTPNQLDAIKNKARGSSMMSMLKKMMRPEELPVQNRAPVQQFHESHGSVHQQMVQHKFPVPSCSTKIHIGTDEITNMKIDLEMCRDVQEFIQKM